MKHLIQAHRSCCVVECGDPVMNEGKEKNLICISKEGEPGNEVEKERAELDGKFISIVTWFKIEFHKSSAVREPFAYFTRKTKKKSLERYFFYC